MRSNCTDTYCKASYTSTPERLASHFLQSYQQRMFCLTVRVDALQETADLVASNSDWGPLYNSGVLAKTTVPVASATYFEVTHLLASSLCCAMSIAWLRLLVLDCHVSLSVDWVFSL